MHHVMAREGQRRAARDLGRTNRPASVFGRDIARLDFRYLLAASKLEDISNGVIHARDHFKPNTARGEAGWWFE
jgi:hypothetical protein